MHEHIRLVSLVLPVITVTVTFKIFDQIRLDEPFRTNETVVKQVPSLIPAERERERRGSDQHTGSAGFLLVCFCSRPGGAGGGAAPGSTQAMLPGVRVALAASRGP